MPLGMLAPIVPFVALLFTRLWLAASLSATAGGAAAWFLLHLPVRSADGDWLYWLVLLVAGAVSLVMALAETVVAAIVLRGRFFRGLLGAVAAHAAWLAYWASTLSASGRRDPWLLIALTAMAGATGATLGAARRRA